LLVENRKNLFRQIANMESWRQGRYYKFLNMEGSWLFVEVVGGDGVDVDQGFTRSRGNGGRSGESTLREATM
jgi:hypothetical protein